MPSISLWLIGFNPKSNQSEINGIAYLIKIAKLMKIFIDIGTPKTDGYIWD